MSKSYSILRGKMKPAARKQAAAKTKLLLAKMPLQELRQARNLTQEQLAESLSVKQAAVSKLEKRTDMYVSTLRNFIKAMGGDLEIIAKFPDGAVQINQFMDIGGTTDILLHKATCILENVNPEDIEHALANHPKVVDAAVVDNINESHRKFYAYVTLRTGVAKSEKIKKELMTHIRSLIGPITTPYTIQWADGLPKTRSGKIMKNILKRKNSDGIIKLVELEPPLNLTE